MEADFSVFCPIIENLINRVILKRHVYPRGTYTESMGYLERYQFHLVKPIKQ